MRAFTLWILASFMVLSGHAQSVTPDTSAMVTAYDAYDQKPNRRSRRDLMRALEAYSGDPTTETVRAHLKVLGADSQTTKYRNLRESALATTSHLETVKEILPRPYIEARYLAAIALFNWRHDDDAIIEMAHVQGLISQASHNQAADWARPLGYKADAWQLAMRAYFESIGNDTPTGTRLRSIRASYESDAPRTSIVGEPSVSDQNQLPHCRGALQKSPPLEYPTTSARRGMYGAIILGMKFDSDGRVAALEILAAVPLEEFNERALETVGQWKYVAAEDEHPGETCRLSQENVILPLVFNLSG